MLPRLLEPEVMDSPEEARDYDAMDHANVNRAFVDDFLAVWDRHGTVLDVGTGTAQIPIELCRRLPAVQVVAIDLASHMLQLAVDNVRHCGFQDRLQLELRDAKELPYPARSFGAVISNSIVHHIPRPGVVLKEMVRVVRPGGLLFVRDLLRPETAAEVGRLVTLYAGAANSHQQKMFSDSLQAALTLAEVRDLVASLGFSAQTVQQSSDRHWSWQATMHQAE